MQSANASSKTCFKCGIEKPRDEFYKHEKMADGLLGKCKECARADNSANRLRRLEYYRTYDSERARNKGRMARAAEMTKRWRLEDRRRGAAHNAVARAVRSGRIEPAPCCVCGSEKSVAHHESYDRPLDVVWYCQAHHKARHKEMAKKGIDP